MPNFKLKKEFLLLILISLVGAFVYFYKLGSIPPGLYLDEVGTGYNAYSIYKTGKDEYGKFLPMAIRLFGSYSPPLYIYLSVPVMALFDLSIFSTRFVSAICGIVTITIVYLIVKELKITKSKHTPFITALFFAITPWTVFFSRMGYEQNLAFLFFSLSIFLVLRALKAPKILSIAIPVISLATYTDYPQRLLAPLLFIGIFLIYKKSLLTKQNIKYLSIGVIIAALIQIPNLLMLFTPSFFTKTGHFYVEAISSQAQKISHYLPMVIALPLAFIREFFSKFAIYFSPQSLFFTPDSDLQRSIPELSVFYPWMVIPFLVGFYYLGKIRQKKSIKLIAFLMLITPIPGALTKQPFHIQRTLPLLLPITLIIAVGIDKLIQGKRKVYWLSATLILFVVSLITLWRSYFVLLPQERAVTWGYGYPKLAEYIRNNPDKTFVIDQSERTGPKDIAYIQMAFYLKLPPELLQADQDKRIAQDYYNQIDYSFVHKFLNIETRQIDWGEAYYRDVVFVGDLVSISDLEVELHSLTKEFEILDPNEIVIFRGYRSNPKSQ